jgi:hypothetical protein
MPDPLVAGQFPDHFCMLVIFVCFSLVIQSACEETWQTYDNIIDSGAKVPEWWDIPRKFEREIEVLNDEEFSNRFHDEFFLKKPVSTSNDI